MGFFGKHRLVAHPDHPPMTVRSVDVDLRPAQNGGLFLSYAVEPAGSLRLSDYGPERRDGLWNSTCFELFLKAADGGYREFNFAPLMAWNAYRFTGWRQGMAALELADAPHLVDLRVDDRRGSFPARYELDVVLTGEALAEASRQASLTAVIEEADGTKSYWALAHPPGAPNFHNPACFTLELPPAPAK